MTERASPRRALRELVAAELGHDVEPRARAMAEAVAARHPGAARAVLFYGSCLREERLDGLMDFYLIVSDYSAAYGKKWLAAANRLIPPNVFYVEQDGLAAKYAVLSEADFAHECGPDAWTVSTAARFAQPARLAWAADAAAADDAVSSVAKAAPTLLGWAVPVAPAGASVAELWRCAFALTFGAELRAERSNRPSALIDADPERYEAVGQASLAEIATSGAALPGREQAARWWRGKQRHGKLYSVARLAKASLTFAGGADYIAWKVNRHAGTQIALTPWQRRHPLLAGISLLPRLLRSGAVR